MAALPGAYVRLVEPKDYDEAAWTMTRPFVRDPTLNWYGCVKELFPEELDARTLSPRTLNTLPKQAKRTVKKLYTFQRGLLKATVVSGGVATVAIVPEPAGNGGQAPREVIAAVSLWLKPGQSMDFSVMTTIRSGLWKLPFTWGLTSVCVRTCSSFFCILAQSVYVENNEGVFACSRTVFGEVVRGPQYGSVGFMVSPSDVC